MINACITGATGYTGAELVRILSFHPEVNIAMLVSQNFVGKKFSDIYTSLHGICDLECVEMNTDLITSPEKSIDLVINALPHGVSKSVVPSFVAAGIRVIDLSADFRYRDVSIYEKTYNTVHEAPELSVNAAYGLPELYRNEIAGSSLVAIPGCYPNCSILGLAPLFASKSIKSDGIIIDALSGISGAGRKAELPYQFCESSQNFLAYGVAKHRHTSEIEQEYSSMAGQDVAVTFTPHLIPVNRGMLCTIYADPIDANSLPTQSELVTLYTEYYKNEPFVRVLAEGEFPQVKSVAGSNYIDIGVTIDDHTKKIIAISSQDNMVKGSSGQAVQNMNIMFGFPETTGLTTPSLYL
jgi:N-acetyl-gamma-glutamyl-phosphate reductase